MTLCGLRYHCLLGFLVSSGSWLVSPDADACSCFDGDRLVWPRGSETNVPLDTSVVVSGSGGFAAAGSLLLPPDAGAQVPVPLDGGVTNHPSGLHLVSPTGDFVALAEQRRLPAVDCIFSYRFYKQVEGKLEANTSYHIYEGQTFVATFTTGTERRDVYGEIAAAKALQLETLGTSEPSRITTAYISEVPSNVAFLHYEGSDQEVTYPLFEGSGIVEAYDFGAAECPVVEIVGMDGVALDQRTLCEPERCMAPSSEVSYSSCGGNHSVGINYHEFTMLPLCTDSADAGGAPLPEPSSVPPADSSSGKSTDTFPSVTLDASAGEDSAPELTSDSATASDDDPGPNKVPVDENSRDDGGCSVRGGTEESRGWWVVLAILGLAVRRKRR